LQLKLNKGGLTYKVVVKEGSTAKKDVGQAVVAAAFQYKADVIVLGTRRASAITKVLFPPSSPSPPAAPPLLSLPPILLSLPLLHWIVPAPNDDGGSCRMLWAP